MANLANSRKPRWYRNVMRFADALWRAYDDRIDTKRRSPPGTIQISQMIFPATRLALRAEDQSLQRQ
jgi:hypothetical protein